MALSNYLDRKVLEHVLGVQAYTPASNLYLGLFVGNPESGGTEVSQSSYYRRGISFNVVTDNLATNAADIDFIINESFGLIDYVGVFDALTGGNLLISAQTGSPLNGSDTPQVFLRAGALSIRLNNG
jgi:hypothetical protein